MKIVDLLRIHDISQGDIARRCHINPNRMSQIANGKIKGSEQEQWKLLAALAHIWPGEVVDEPGEPVESEGEDMTPTQRDLHSGNEDVRRFMEALVRQYGLEMVEEAYSELISEEVIIEFGTYGRLRERCEKKRYIRDFGPAPAVSVV